MTADEGSRDLDDRSQKADIDGAARFAEDFNATPSHSGRFACFQYKLYIIMERQAILVHLHFELICKTSPQLRDVNKNQR